MQSQPDAVVSQSILREVVRADLLTAVTRLDLRLARGSYLLLLFLQLDVVQFCPQNLHSLLAVLKLGALSGACNRNTGWLMCHSHRSIVFLHVLATGATGAKGVEVQVRGVYMQVYVLEFRQHCNGGCGGVDTALRFGFRHPLDSMHSALVAESAERPSTLEGEDDFLVAAHIRWCGIQYLGLPALELSISAVHGEQISGKQSGFITAGACPDLEHRIFVVRRIARHQHASELFLQRLHGVRSFVMLDLQKLAHIPAVGISQQLCSLVTLLLGLQILFIGMPKRLQFSMATRQVTIAILVTDNRRVTQSLLELL